MHAVVTQDRRAVENKRLPLTLKGYRFDDRKGQDCDASVNANANFRLKFVLQGYLTYNSNFFVPFIFSHWQIQPPTMSLPLDGLSCAKQYKMITARKPVVQCITNFVSMDLMANCLNAVGASPAMVSLCRLSPMSEGPDITSLNRSSMSIGEKSQRRTNKSLWPQVHSVDEVEEFLGVADALVVNVGTLSKEWVESMRLAAKVASKLGKPWVLDPVGAGATKFRTQVNQACCLSPPLILAAC